MSDPVFVRARRAVLPGGERAVSIVAAEGVIQKVGGYEDAPPPGAREVDAGENVLLPGLVDAHVHCNEPGRTAWEGFETATRAAAAGGVTTVVDMPLNSLPPTTTREALRSKEASATETPLFADLAFWGGAVPGRFAEWEGMAEAGICGFKAFLADSGVPEFPPLPDQELEAALAEAARWHRPLLVHAEAQDCLRSVGGGTGVQSYASWLASRPPAAETKALERIVVALRELAARRVFPHVHVVHLSAAEGVTILRSARAEGLRMSAETCPHYLTLAAEDIEDGATLFKCAPPIRARSNQAALWQALLDGDVDCIASDHSPSPPEGKALDDGDFARAWGGIASLGLTLPIIWTAARERGIPLHRLVTWMAGAPARLAGLASRKGALAPDRDADFVFFDPNAMWEVTVDQLWTRHRITPYAGQRLQGRVRATWLRGLPVYGDDVFSGTGHGRILRRETGVLEESP